MSEEELLYEKIYKDTKECGRTQFVKLLQQNQIKIKQLQQENQQLKEKVDTQYNGIVEKDNMLRNRYGVIEHKQQQLDLYKSVVDEVYNHCELMLRIFEKMNNQQRDENLERFKPYDYVLRILGKVKESDK